MAIIFPHRRPIVWDLNIELLGGTTPDNLADLRSDPAGGGEPIRLYHSPIERHSVRRRILPTPRIAVSTTRRSALSRADLSIPAQAYVYNVPGGGVTSESAYFVLRAWTGDFTSFNAALVGGALVGTTPVFLNPVESGINPIRRPGANAGPNHQTVLAR